MSKIEIYDPKTIHPTELSTLRTLAERLAKIASLPVHRQKISLWTDINDLSANTRPVVLIDEICWHEFQLADHIVSVHPVCRELEFQLRKTLCCWENMPVDWVVDDFIVCPLKIRNSGFGIQETGQQLHTAEKAVVSRHFEPQIRSEEDINKIQNPIITWDEESTEKKFHFMRYVFDDVLPVKKLGCQFFWFAPWDVLVTWWGVQEALMDLVLRPELVKSAMQRLVDAYLAGLEQYESLSAMASNNANTRVGSGGLGYTKQLPAEENPIKARHLWGSSTAQIFSEVSPDMHEEFALHFERKWLDRFGMNYYGCCEPLHHKINIIKKIPRLRKISISPWADLQRAVSEINRDYVISYKPNPALLAGEHWDVKGARETLIHDLNQLKGCAVEIIMKDISTVRNQPHRLFEWAKMASEVVNNY